MATTEARTRVRMTRAKFESIDALANDHGVIAAAAMDQRGSLKKAIAKARDGREVSDGELSEFKAVVTEVLTPHATAILMDPEYGLDAVKHRAPGAGVLLAYEKSGYDTKGKGRLPDLLPEWSVKRLVEAEADAIKILLYYDPDDDPAINTIKHAFIERIGAECRANGVAFFLEPLCYSDEIGDEKGLEFARAKPSKVKKYMAEFSEPRYGVDVLKVEIPVNARYVEGSAANTDGVVAYSRDEAKQHYLEAASASRLPFIYLSAGVTDAVFRESLQMAIEAGSPFAGVLCGRATWQDGIPEYASGGAEALRGWLQDRGVKNVQQLNAVLDQGAQPWWDSYGGRENIEIVEPET